MLNTVHTQSPRNVFERQSSTANGQQPRSGVWQDNPTTPRERIASPQPDAVQLDMRAHQMNNKKTRSQKKTRPKRRTAQLIVWVKPVVKAELQRIAEREGLSLSATGAAFLEKSLQHHIDLEYSALLQPIIESAIQKQMRSYSTRLAVLLVRCAFASEQTRSLVTNILGRQPGISPQELNAILDGSSNAAKSKITRKTPQLEDVLTEMEQWLTEGEGEPHA